MPRHDVVKSELSDEYFTPDWIFNDLGLEFDLDVASSHLEGVKVPTKNRFTKADDGLIQQWNGIVWMNPPFSKVTPWIVKFREHNNGIALLPFAKSLWFIDLWNDDKALIATLPSRLKFNHAEDGIKGIYAQSFLVAMGHKAQAALVRSQIAKIR